MRRFVGLCYINFSPFKSMESQLSLEKKINVPRPKLIENERNEVLKNFHFFQKKSIFFSNSENPLKNNSTSKLYTIVANHFLKILKVSLESSNFTLYVFEALNATISLYVKSSHLETKRSQLNAVL